jgi:FKBP-type peptidyl-prolyl cis-trans isomerase
LVIHNGAKSIRRKPKRMSRRSLTTGFLLFLAGAVGFAIGQAQEPTANPPAAASPELKTLEEQAAYALGFGMGRDALADSPELSPELIARGLIDAMKKAKSLLTEQQLQVAADKFLAKKLGPGAEKNLEEGQKFLTDNKSKQGVTTTDTGLQYFVIKAGNGRSPLLTDVVKVNYTGMFLDGKRFETTEGKSPAEFPVNRVIPGWTEALQKMKTGDKWRLYVPPHLAYGPQGPSGGPIPPFATLIFDIELLDIVR